jgi:hypothetical protein
LAILSLSFGYADGKGSMIINKMYMEDKFWEWYDRRNVDARANYER